MAEQDMAFDPLSANFAEDPYKIYAELRAADHPYRFDTMDMWLLSRFDDVCAIATNPAMVRALDGLVPQSELKARQRQANWHEMPYHERVVQFSLLDSDGAVHRRLRKQIFAAFTARAVAPLEPAIRSFVDTQVAAIAGLDRFDFVADFAAHIPGFVIGHLLGAPQRDHARLRLWSEQVVRFFDIDRSHEKKQAAETATREFFHYLEALKIERIKRPRNDLISAMIEQERQGGFSGDEFISTCMLILMAGHGSTIDVLGSGMHTLIRHPDILNRLRAKPEGLAVAIQEMFRFEPPLPFFHRHATEEVVIRGQRFPKGTTFGLLYAAANRDPMAFENADQFVVNRQPNRHLAFGQGAHLCLGNHLARLTMRIVFETLLARFSEFELAEAPVVYKRGLSVRGPQALFVQFS